MSNLAFHFPPKEVKMSKGVDTQMMVVAVSNKYYSIISIVKSFKNNDSPFGLWES